MLKPSTITTDKILHDLYLQFVPRMRRQPGVMQWSVGGTVDRSNPGSSSG